MVDKRDEKKQDDNHSASEDAACYSNCAGRENKPTFHTCTAVQHCPQ